MMLEDVFQELLKLLSAEKDFVVQMVHQTLMG